MEFFGPVSEEILERRGAFGLNHCQARKAIDQADGEGFAQTFTECGHVAEVSARQHDPIRHMPIALIEHLKHDALLAFDTKRVDGVEEIDAHLLGEDSYQR